MTKIPREIREVKDKVVVITGGTSGIGLSIAKLMLKNGAKYVALFELDHKNSRIVFDELHKQYHDRIGFYPCDVTKTDLISDNFDKVMESHKTIDILINNAGIAGENEPELLVDVNLKALVVASYKIIDRIGKQNGGKGGVIVNMASIAGIASGISPVYCATKHGVVGFTRTLQLSYGVTGVRVLAICPSFTNTPIIKMGVVNDLEYLKQEGIDTVPADVYLQSPDSVAKAIIDAIKTEDGDASVWVVTRDEPAFPFAEKVDLKSLW
ncbi:alcohol dehydrogenase-like isoform X1 [Nasonia vitripennis]|uniref:Short-chain dehydrogenase n=5 Tax=Nasonia vitripennis TaxID=7425 RepID=A0A7M7TBH7_NASVI|nr:alcohol dehydrogenase-like [Nasonia vitripennis]XP_008215016.2 alcohol dehydrogenase-like isoform X1 [Nasonia vitripennis]XP_008215019.1 alcohol dehydrogenase-like isoform X1 [Nasonia vitripennis]XP_031789329.1 alcohol dehydrogenase-like isoform X1 [Nasonia vitripennis]XP_032453518.1 alcohol dehydrogenase-like isoform X1 [Nasonia vitripennis]